MTQNSPETPSLVAIETPDALNVDLADVQDTIIGWIQDNILIWDSAAQLSIIVFAFIFAFAFGRVLKPRLIDTVNKIPKIPFRLTQILHNLTKLVFPLIALVTIFVGSKIAGDGGLGFNVTFCAVLIKLLFAWIVIRTLMQFIENNFARNMFALIIWSIAALSIFGVLDQITQTMDAIGISFGSFRISALGVVKGILAITALLYGASFLAGFAERRLAKIETLNAASRVLIGKIIRIVLLFTAIIIGITTAGIDLSVFAVFSGAVGLGVGFGLQRGISNLFSGMMLLVDQSIKPGDIIEVPSPDGTSTTFGWVNEMGGRQTEIITRDNKSFLIPNEHLITQQVVNWSRGDTLVRMEVRFGVHYDSDPHEVRRICAEAAQKPERVQSTPEPVCHIVGFGDSSLDFALRFWIRDAHKGVTNVRGEVFLAVWDAFKEHDIKIPYPHREVFMHEAQS